MDLQRYEDWPSRLDDFFRANIAREFLWGSFDCALFAADGVEATTGRDFAAAFRGKYKSERGSALALKKYGAGDLPATVTKFLGPQLKSVLKAQRGDIVSHQTPDGVALGIVNLKGTHFFAVSREGGLIEFPMTQALTAWRV